uniref:Uncharacterized protein n=1 Tax=Oncorhynchus tshawytscha TaxID=74940 RepID=A0AAZ3RK54_ONCTS
KSWILHRSGRTLTYFFTEPGFGISKEKQRFAFQDLTKAHVESGHLPGPDGVPIRVQRETLVVRCQ